MTIQFFPFPEDYVQWMEQAENERVIVIVQVSKFKMFENYNSESTKTKPFRNGELIKLT